MGLNEDGLKIAIVGALALGLLWLVSKQIDSPAAPRRSKPAPVIDVEAIEDDPPADPAKEPAPTPA